MRQQGRDYRAYDANTGRWKMVRHRSQTPYSRVTLIPPRERYVPSLIDLSVEALAEKTMKVLKKIRRDMRVSQVTQEDWSGPLFELRERFYVLIGRMMITINKTLLHSKYDLLEYFTRN